jgi:hypothetical protein
MCQPWFDREGVFRVRWHAIWRKAEYSTREHSQWGPGNIENLRDSCVATSHVAETRRQSQRLRALKNWSVRIKVQTYQFGQHGSRCPSRLLGRTGAIPQDLVPGGKRFWLTITALAQNLSVKYYLMIIDYLSYLGCLLKIPLRWILIGLAIASTVAPVFGQAPQASVDAFQAVSDAGLPTDWTHRHAIFSSPSSLRSPSIQDCEKSFARTGVASENLKSHKADSSTLIQVHLAESCGGQTEAAIHIKP